MIQICEPFLTVFSPYITSSPDNEPSFGLLCWSSCLNHWDELWNWVKEPNINSLKEKETHFLSFGSPKHAQFSFTEILNWTVSKERLSTCSCIISCSETSKTQADVLWEGHIIILQQALELDFVCGDVEPFKELFPLGVGTGLMHGPARSLASN